MGIRWMKNAVVSIGLKSGRRAIAQMLEEPYLHFFHYFSAADEDVELDLNRLPSLFCCAVTRQFLRFSDVRKEPTRRPRSRLKAPLLWIDTHDGWRDRVVWPNTKRERTVEIMGAEPGGRLTPDDDDDDVGEEIELDDHATIDAYELTNIWTFPLLNERLHLCDVLGKNVGPLKDLSFDRPLPFEAAIFVDMIGSVGDLESWGYTLPGAARTRVPAKKSAAKKTAAKKSAAKKRAAKKRAAKKRRA